MRTLLEVFTATSVPAGSYLLLLAMGFLGTSPKVPAMSLSAPKSTAEAARWVSLPASELHLDVGLPAAIDPAAIDPAAIDPAAIDPAQMDPAQTAAEQAMREPAPRDASGRALETAAHRAGNRSSPAPQARGRQDEAPPQAKKNGRECLQPTDAIVQTGQSSWQVERSFVEALAGDREAASSLAVMSWHEQAGAVDGFKLRRVRCGSPLYQAGFRNGDVVHSVNGHDITSLSEAIWAFGVLRKDTNLKVRLTRRSGSSAKLSYRIQ